MSLSTPPLSHEPLHFRFPSTEHTTMPDGSTVWLIHRPDEDVMSVSVIGHTGCVDDTIAGETAFAASMMSRGTVQRTAEEFADAVELRGCSVSSSADRENISVAGSGLGEYATDLVDLVLASALTPRFDEAEIERQRTVRIADCMMNLDDPDYLAAIAEARVAFHGHPYAQPREGTPSTLRSITRDNMRSVHRRFLAARRTIVVSGSFNKDAVLQQLHDALAAHAQGQTSVPPSNRPAPRMLHRTACIAVKEDAVQSALRIGLPMVPMLHEDAVPMQILASVLGGYTMARLFTVLREQKGYTYGAYAFPNQRLAGQSVDIVTSVGNAFTADTVATIRDEVERMHTQRIDEEELFNAKQHMLGQFARSNETPQQTANLVWMRILYGLPDDYFERYIERVQRITPDELFEVQQRMFDHRTWVIGASGTRDVLTEAIAPVVDSITELDEIA